MCCWWSRRAGASDNQVARVLARQRTEYEIFRIWCRRGAIITVLLGALVFAGLQVYHLHLHARQRYAQASSEAETNRTLGIEAFAMGGCASKPAGYKTPLLDCDLASQWKDLDPHSFAMETVVHHLLVEHISPVSWITGCHEGTCNGLLWLVAEKILLNFIPTIVAVTFPCTLALALALYIYWQCNGSLRAYRTTEFQMSRQPHIQAANSLAQRNIDSMSIQQMLQASAVEQNRMLHKMQQRHQAEFDSVRGILEMQAHQAPANVDVNKFVTGGWIAPGKDAIAVRLLESTPEERLHQYNAASSAAPTDNIRKRYALAAPTSSGV